MLSSNFSTCSDSLAIIEHGLVQASLVIGAILSPVGVALNALLLFALKRATAFHLNVRIQIGNISLSSAMFCICFIARAACLLVFGTLSNDYACQLSLQVRTCILVEVPYSLCTGALIASIFAVGVERAIATRLHASYEESSHRLAYVMAGLCWLNGPFGNVFLFVFAEEGHVMPVCAILFASDKMVMVAFLVVEILLCVAILVEYVVLIRVNERKLFDYCANRALLKLTSRLQLRHNLQLAEMLLPSVVIHTSIMSITTGVAFWLLYHVVGDDFSPVDYGIYFVLNVVVVVYTIVHPLICFWRCEMLRRGITNILILRRILSWLCPEAENAPRRLDSIRRRVSREIEENEMNAHFMLLESMWEKGPK